METGPPKDNRPDTEIGIHAVVETLHLYIKVAPWRTLLV